MSNSASRIRPSSAHLWVPCPGSVQLSARHGLPDGDSPEAEEGIKGHKVAEMMLRKRLWPSRDYGGAGEGVTATMLDAAQVWVDHASGLVAKTGVAGGPNIGAETFVLASRIHVEAHGTCDFWLYDRRTETLYVRDYKYGFEVVEPRENWQLIVYASGLLELLQLSHWPNLNLGIVQPRAPHPEGPVRTWQCDGVVFSQLRDHAKRSAYEALTSNEPYTEPGPQCKYCPARHACSTLRNSVHDAIRWFGHGEGGEQGPEAVGLELEWLREGKALLESRLSGLEEQAKSMAAEGNPPSGWRVERSYGREKWNVDPDTLEQTASMLGVDVMRKQVLTPNQTRDKLKAAGVSANALDRLTYRPSKGWKLVRTDESVAHSVFGRQQEK